MTPVIGEESPTSEAIVSQPVVCISPVVNCQLAEVSAGELLPVAEDHVPAPVEEDRIDGETFAERMARLGIAIRSPAWRPLYIEFQQEVRRRAENEVAEAEEPAAKAQRQGEAGDDDEEAGEEGVFDEDGAIVFEGVPAEGREARLPADVPIPSREMVRRHRAAGHCPYKPWCAHCVANAANAPSHHPRSAPISDTPEIHCDYAFFRDRRGDKQNTATVLVVKDRGSKAFGANVVPQKGTGDGFAVKQFDRDIRRFGHRGAVTLRSDGEMAVKDLLNRVAAFRAQRTNVEHSPVGDSRANGMAERAIQSVEKQVRIIKSSTEDNVGKFGVKHAAFPWLVIHSADVLNKFLVGSDGLTAYERIKGRAFSGVMLEFGCVVLYKVSMKVQGGLMQPRWERGVWLGKQWGTEEHLISTEEGHILRSAAVKPHPEKQWDSALFDGIKGSPWDPLAKNVDKTVVEAERAAEELPRFTVERSVDPMLSQPRRAMISPDILDRVGFSDGCAKCTAIRIGDDSKSNFAHSKACRLRIERRMAEDPFMKVRLDDAVRRQDEYLERRVEAGDLDAKRRKRAAEEAEASEPAEAAAAAEPAPPTPPAPAEGGRSRAASTVTCMSDVRPASTVTCATDVAVDAPVPAASDPASSSAGPVGQKRGREDDDEGDAERTREDRTEDPDDPKDDEMGCIDVPEVLMLGQKRKNKPLSSAWKEGIYDIVELFSQPRVTKVATEMGLRGGWSCDVNHKDPITNRSYDLSSTEDQNRVWRMLGQDKPLVVGLSPPCTLFSQLQNLRKTEIDPVEMAKAIEYIRFSVRVARYQMRKGRFFYFEHPLTATSWNLDELWDILQENDVEAVIVHMCRFGLIARDEHGEGLVRKATKIATNLPSIASAVNLRCEGGHRHVHLVSGRAAAAAEYAPEFCRAVVTGISVHLQHVLTVCEMGSIFVECEEQRDFLFGVGFDCCDPSEEIPFTFNEWGYCIDDVNGGTLPMDLVREARRSEIAGFTERKVYQIRPRHEAQAAGGKVVGVRWVDSAKNGGVRSRLVCQDFNQDKKHTDEMFAPTPPLMSSRWLVSRMASQGLSGPGGMRLMGLDFSKAFLYGDMERQVYIDLPDEDARKFQGDYVGLLNKSMYGLRDAPQIWQRVVHEMLTSRGFVSLSTTQCVYVNLKLDITIVAHVDDLLCLGSRRCLEDFLASLRGEYECSGDILGPADDEVKSLKFLGRTIAYTPAGLEWEGDKKHCVAFFQKLGVDPKTLSGVQTPGAKVDNEKGVSEGKTGIPLSAADAKLYRGCVALLNYMSQDRADLSVASKEVSKNMASPTSIDWAPVKRVARYLSVHPRCVSLFPWQMQVAKVSAYTDSDWAGDIRTRKSTSGGCLLRGRHLVCHWSRTQQNIALSSAEAELNGICKASAEGLGAVYMARELGEDIGLEVLTDSSAARGVIQRSGSGRIKHLQVKQLWVQERESRDELVISKLPREHNVADLLTHHYSESEWQSLSDYFCIERRPS